MVSKYRSAVIGPRGENLSRTLFAAVALFVSTAAVLAIVSRFMAPFASPLHEILYLIHRALWWEGYTLGLVAGIALITVRQQSLLSAWILAFAGGAGVGINLGGIGLNSGMPSLLFRVLWTVGLGLATALVIGTAGYLIGQGISRNTQ